MARDRFDPWVGWGCPQALCRAGGTAKASKESVWWRLDFSAQPLAGTAVALLGFLPIQSAAPLRCCMGSSGPGPKQEGLVTPSVCSSRTC